MANHAGWWTLNVSNKDTDDDLELSDCDKEHIADCVKKGYTSGEIVQDEEV